MNIKEYERYEEIRELISNKEPDVLLENIETMIALNDNPVTRLWRDCREASTGLAWEVNNTVNNNGGIIDRHSYFNGIVLRKKALFKDGKEIEVPFIEGYNCTLNKLHCLLIAHAKEFVNKANETELNNSPFAFDAILTHFDKLGLKK